MAQGLADVRFLTVQEVADMMRVSSMTVYRLVHSGEIELVALLKAMSTRPAEMLRLPGGSLKPGSIADVIVIDPDVPWVLERDDLKSKCKNTPFDEAKLQGRVVRTIIGGRTVYEYV